MWSPHPKGSLRQSSGGATATSLGLDPFLKARAFLLAAIAGFALACLTHSAAHYVNDFAGVTTGLATDFSDKVHRVTNMFYR